MRMKQYIHLKNKTYYFRARYPTNIVAAKLVKGEEMKRSLRTDSYQEAVKKFPQAMLEYNSIVDEAERKLALQNEGKPKELSEGDISNLVAAWYKQSKDMYQYSTKSNKSDGDAVAERRAFFERSEASIRHKKEVMLGLGNYDAVYSMVKGILKRANLTADIDSEVYNTLCHTVLRAWIDLEETAVQRLKGDFSDKPSDSLISALRQATSPTMVQHETEAATERSISDLIDAFTKDKQVKWAKKTKMSYVTVFGFLKAALGANTNINQVDRGAARALLETISTIPSNWKKKPELEGLALSAAISKADALSLPKITHLTATGTYLRSINTLFAWALKEGWIARNNFDGLEIAQTDEEEAEAAQNRKMPIPLPLLRTLFNSQPWKSRDESYKGNSSFYWGPLIALFHGCRVGEIASLLVSDIITVDGVPAISFTNILGDETFYRKYKAKSTVRDVPIHPELLKLGFLEFVNKQKFNGHHQLFPANKKDTRDQWGRELTRWFNPHLTKLSDKPIRCSFHSFRHGFEDAQREAGIYQTPEGLTLGGRVDKNHNAVASGYGIGFKVSTLLPHIAKVKYEGLDLSHLYVQPTSQPDVRPKAP